MVASEPQPTKERRGKRLSETVSSRRLADVKEANIQT
jgi:hypothetical protein